MTNVCMVVRNRPRLTQQSLSSLYDSTDHRDFTLTVVDDASESATQDFLVHMAEMLGFTLHRQDEAGGVGYSKNQAVRASELAYGRGQFLYLTDNDVYFKPNWLPVLTGILKTRMDFKLIGGWNHPFHHPISRMKVITGFKKPALVELIEQFALSGCSWLMSWDTWDRFGPLDANALGVRQSEDTAFCNRIREAGFRTGCIWPHVVLHTGATDTFGDHPPGWELFQKEDGVLIE